MRYTYEDLLSNPDVLDRIREEAHRERARAMHELVISPIKNFFASHAARPHLARQG